MHTNGRGKLPGDLARGRNRFQAWRARREGRGPIPRSLWALAVELVNRHGVSRTAAALKLDYYSLKRQAEASASKSRSSGPAFVELPSPVAVSKQCHFELSNGTGVTMRVQLMGYDTADVEALTRGFWNAE
jgi:hypothetical protein